jgi:hypothetical protein
MGLGTGDRGRDVGGLDRWLEEWGNGGRGIGMNRWLGEGRRKKEGQGTGDRGWGVGGLDRWWEEWGDRGRGVGDRGRGGDRWLEEWRRKGRGSGD